jgi:hypothetical protein
MFLRNIYIACLIVKLVKESEHIYYASHYKIKTTIKLSILDHTLICVIKPWYYSTKSI